MDNNEMEKDSSEIIIDDDKELIDDSKESNLESDISYDNIVGDDSDTFTYRVSNDKQGNKDSDNSKSLLYAIIGALILVSIIVILIVIVNKNSFKESKYSDIESKMVEAAKRYYEKNNTMLPDNDGAFVTVSADDLITNSFLKPFSEMVSEGVSCSGEVNVYKNSDGYMYFPYLNCGEKYESLKLSHKIIDSGIVSSGDGLYKVDDDYIFRGEYPNNFVKFDGKLWRIIKINSDDSIKLIYAEKKTEKSVWDDRYNSSRESYVGINDFSISRILDYLKKSYDDNTFVSKKNKDLLVKHNWCIGKISQFDSSISGLDVCGETYNDLYIGLINVVEVLVPSIDKNCTNLYDIECTNYNYFFSINSGWTLNASSDKSFIVFSSNGGAISNKNASVTSYVRPVININGNVLYNSGDGTSENPYVIGD